MSIWVILLVIMHRSTELAIIAISFPPYHL